MTTRIQHIPDPHVGWYLCGHIPLHRNGRIVSRKINAEDDVRTCKRCLAAKRSRKLPDIANVGGDLLGATET